MEKNNDDFINDFVGVCVKHGFYKQSQIVYLKTYYDAGIKNSNPVGKRLVLYSEDLDMTLTFDSGNTDESLEKMEIKQ